ncbi:CynX/NimT family MFS transporter [Thermodesulfobacteriota bacterium]
MSTTLRSNRNNTVSDQTPYRWSILALVWLLYLSHGVVQRSASPLVTPILNDLNMSYGQMGFVLGSWQLTYLIVALMAGYILDCWGVKKSLFFGTVIISLSAALRYFAQGFGSFLLMVVLFGIGGSLISIGAPKAISLWFSGKERGTAVGIYSTGPKIGQMFVLGATNGIVMPLTGNSWRLTFVFYGLFAFGTAMLWWFFAKDASETDISGGFSINRVVRRLLKIHNVRIILIAGLLSLTLSHGFIGWLPKLLENSGLSPKIAGIYSALPFFSTIPAVLIIPRTTPHHLRSRMIALMALLASTAIILVATLKVPLMLILLLYGIAGSSLTPLMVLILMETPKVGSEYMGAAVGMLFCISEIGGFVGPYIVGVLVDLTGSFLAGSTFLSLSGCAIVALMFLIKKDN